MVGVNILSVLLSEAAANYNPIAGFYQQHWSSHYHPWAVLMLEKVLLSRVPEGARLLDVCCGNGVIAKHLTQRGYHVTGVDASQEMLRYARKNSPESQFLIGDARSMCMGPSFHGALSTFDSLNHILSPEELLQVFRNVRQSLLPGGVFVFDMNLEQSYRTAWNNTCSIVDDKHACFIRGSYDAASRIGRTEITLFEENGAWCRSDVTLLQRFHPTEDTALLLRDSGFHTTDVYDAVDDLHIEGSFGEGRAVFVATL